MEGLGEIDWSLLRDHRGYADEVSALLREVSTSVAAHEELRDLPRLAVAGRALPAEADAAWYQHWRRTGQVGELERLGARRGGAAVPSVRTA